MTLNLFISAILLFHEIYEREKQWKQNKTKQNKTKSLWSLEIFQLKNKTKQNDITSKSSFCDVLICSKTWLLISKFILSNFDLQ